MIMTRLFPIFGFLALLFAATPGYGNGQELPHGLEEDRPVTLQENILVTGPYIRLGDFFTNVPTEQASTAIAYSPKPGRKATFDARWLYRVAHAYGLKWRPLSADLTTTVSRDSLIVTREEITDALSLALQEYDLPENPLIELSNKNLRVHIPSDIMPEITVEDVLFNQSSKRFSAILNIGETARNAITRIRVTGQVHKMLEVPTLVSRKKKGEIIRENDLSYVQVRADRTQRDVVTDPSKLIGMAVKRHMRADQSIRSSEIQRPLLVERGSLVTIILKKPGMTLTSQGRALEHGADGQVVQITNTKSNRKLEAIVVGPNMVTVLPAGYNPAQLAYKN